MKGVLVNVSDAVVDEGGGEKDGKTEDFHIMIGLFIQGSKTLGIDDKDMFIILGMDGLIPNPKSLGAGVDGWTYTETLAFV